MNDYKFLKNLKRKGKLDYDKLSELEKDFFERLRTEKKILVEFTSTGKTLFSIASLGLNFIYEEKKMYCRWFITTVISVCALVISIYSLFT